MCGSLLLMGLVHTVSQFGHLDAVVQSHALHDDTSNFLVQTDTAVFDELVRASSQPCFTTDYGQLRGGYPERVNIPLADEEAHVTFYILKK